MSKTKRSALMAGEREKLSESIVIHMPFSLVEWLDGISREAGIGRSAVIRSLLTEIKRDSEASENEDAA